jgi:hypothetical protein
MSTTQKTIARGRLFSVTTEVDEGRLKQLRKTPEILQAAQQVGADYHHTKNVPEHFKRGAHEKYDYAERTRGYRRLNNGRPDMVKTGRMMRDLIARATFKNSGKGVSLVMQARVLNVAPAMPENSADKYVKHTNKSKRGYPNLKREIKAMHPQELDAIANVVTKELERAYASDAK